MVKERKRSSRRKPSKAVRQRKKDRHITYKAARMQMYRDVRRPEGGPLTGYAGDGHKVVPSLWGNDVVHTDHYDGILEEYSDLVGDQAFNKYVCALMGGNVTEDPEQRGVVCTKEIGRGRLICHYVGKLCEGPVPCGCKYAYAVSKDEYIDATHVVYDYGYIAANELHNPLDDYSKHDIAWNYGRFINTVPGVSDYMDKRFNCYFQLDPCGFPVVRIYSSRTIHPGEELLICYGKSFVVSLGGKFSAPDYVSLGPSITERDDDDVEYIPPSSRNTNSRGI